MPCEVSFIIIIITVIIIIIIITSMQDDEDLCDLGSGAGESFSYSSHTNMFGSTDSGESKHCTVAAVG